MDTTRQGNVLPCKWDKITRALCRFVTVITGSQKPHSVTYGQESRLTDALIPVPQENTETHIILSVSTPKKGINKYTPIVFRSVAKYEKLKIWIIRKIYTALPPKEKTNMEWQKVALFTNDN